MGRWFGVLMFLIGCIPLGMLIAYWRSFHAAFGGWAIAVAVISGIFFLVYFLLTVYIFWCYKSDEEQTKGTHEVKHAH